MNVADINQQLQARGLRDVPGDGNCGFSAYVVGLADLAVRGKLAQSVANGYFNLEKAVETYCERLLQ